MLNPFIGYLADATSLTTAYAASALLALVSIPAIYWLPTRPGKI